MNDQFRTGFYLTLGFLAAIILVSLITGILFGRNMGRKEMAMEMMRNRGPVRKWQW